MLASGHGVACVLGWWWKEVIVGGIRGLTQGGEDHYNQRFLKAVHLSSFAATDRSDWRKHHPLWQSSPLQLISNSSQHSISHHSPRQIASLQLAKPSHTLTIATSHQFLSATHLSPFAEADRCSNNAPQQIIKLSETSLAPAMHSLALTHSNFHSDSMIFLDVFGVPF